MVIIFSCIQTSIEPTMNYAQLCLSSPPPRNTILGATAGLRHAHGSLRRMTG